MSSAIRTTSKKEQSHKISSDTGILDFRTLLGGTEYSTAACHLIPVKYTCSGLGGNRTHRTFPFKGNDFTFCPRGYKIKFSCVSGEIRTPNPIKGPVPKTGVYTVPPQIHKIKKEATFRNKDPVCVAHLTPEVFNFGQELHTLSNIICPIDWTWISTFRLGSLCDQSIVNFFASF